MATKDVIKILDAMDKLTAKQREVLDLLLDHKTSKEIAQTLNISPHTVDQRIQYAKRQLGAISRSDAARIYRDYKEVYNRTTYEDSPILLAPDSPHQSGQDEVKAFHSIRFLEELIQEEGSASRIVPELFVGVKGKGLRLIAILIIALLTMLLALGGLAIYSSLADLLAR